jgi:hypothetical protein
MFCSNGPFLLWVPKRVAIRARAVCRPLRRGALRRRVSADSAATDHSAEVCAALAPGDGLACWRRRPAQEVEHYLALVAPESEWRGAFAAAPAVEVLKQGLANNGTPRFRQRPMVIPSSRSSRVMRGLP